MSEQKQIKVGYDDSGEQRVKVSHRRARAALGALTILGGMYVAGHAGNGNHADDAPNKSNVTFIDNTKSGKDYIPMVSIKVREGENPSVLADELAVSPEMGTRMIAEIKDQEQTPNILPVGQTVQVEAGIIDHDALAARRAENSAPGH